MDANATFAGDSVQFTPEVYYEDAWRPICGHWLWDTAHGAASFCKQLGYAGGYKLHTWSNATALKNDAVAVGKCLEGDVLPTWFLFDKSTRESSSEMVWGGPWSREGGIEEQLC